MSNRSSSQPDLTQDPATFTETEIAEIAERLEKNTYSTVFGCLEDWHKLRAAAFHSPALVAPYAHLLELEIDED